MPVRILGLDPGLRHTGWGIIDKEGSKLKFVAAGVVNPDTTLDLADRLAELHGCLRKIITQWCPDEAAVEETFVNKNPTSTLKLGQARGVVLLAPAIHGIKVAEYTPNQIKKMVVGAGHAEKSQVDLMVHTLLKDVPDKMPPDASDALAIALCHSFMRPINGIKLG
ncbi:MAG: crossover junction endodeoxyribonuclease RuvC [Alphaproteobacteria bacterium]|nr:crossover junction endodeoxyribonuclease RuvC [Alphaproteobacteria bacterium]